MIATDGRHLSFPFRINSDGRTATAVWSLKERVRLPVP